MDAVCNVVWLGLVPYEEAWQLQNRLAVEIAAGRQPPTLLLLEHPHTYTFGRSGHIENLLWDEAELTRRDVAVQWVDRGGDVTYHGPGQLVGYPLLPLGSMNMQVQTGRDAAHLPKADYIGYLRDLEETLMVALSQLGVTGMRLPGLTGVWVQSDTRALPAKIAAIGVKVDARGVTRHGFALNVNPDMSYWDGIIGCGLKEYQVTSLAKLLDFVPTMPEVLEAITDAFCKVFEYR
jgi:lipoate-protein ligase B